MKEIMDKLEYHSKGYLQDAHQNALEAITGDKTKKEQCESRARISNAKHAAMELAIIIVRDNSRGMDLVKKTS